MKQLLQSLKDGTTTVTDIPCPMPKDGELLIASSRTLISAGTERMLVDFGKAGLLGKARQQPDKVRMVLQKIRTDGLVPTFEAVMNQLDRPLPLGYCNVGTVSATGGNPGNFEIGDRVVSNGRHAEMIVSPVNLCARVPDAVTDDAAAFTVLAAIGLQGIRLVKPTLGEAVVVTGLGLIGLIVVQLLRANGCRVLGIDYDPARLRLAKDFGADVVDLSAGADPVAAADRFSRGRGVDAVIVTAATDSSEPMHQAATMCRKRGRIVLVGVTGLELSRADFYEKELSFQVSCSYGPGRHDPVYEDQGVDYPVGYVRWTEQRNFEAVLDLMASDALDMSPLISHRFAIDDAADAYEAITGDAPSLGVLLEYEPAAGPSRKRTITLAPHAAKALPAARSDVRVGFLGAGNYASAVLIPAFVSAGANLRSIMSLGGVSGTHAAKKFGFAESTTDADRVIDDPHADAIVICTQHDSHAQLTCRALAAGKHVFVEKPLALTADELDAVAAQLAATREAGVSPVLMVGFNRRFAPHVVKLRKLLASSQAPAAMVMTVNAGAIPADHWTQDPAVGGGRIIGEACHFVDLLRCLAGSPIERQSTNRAATRTHDTATLSLGFANGSTGTIHYLANGDKSFPKERLEIFCNGGILQLDNFRVLRGFGWPGFRKLKLMKQDKGQRACARAFLDAIRNGADSPIPAEELLETSRVTIALAEAGRD